MRIVLTIFASFSLLFAEGGLLKIDWSKTDKNIQKLRVLPKNLQEKIKDITLPVYMPRYYVYEKNISMVTNPNFYFMTIYLDDARVMVSGDRTYQREILSKDKKFKLQMKSALTDKFVRAEGIMSIDFQRNGLNYSLSIECNRPNSDLRCKDSSFLKKLYNKLILIGVVR